MPAMTLERLLGRYPADVQALAVRARELILHTLREVEESLDGSAGVIGYGYGPGYKGLVCTLILSKTGVKLGLAHGARLPDPDRLLEGSGKTHRYVPLRAPSDIRKPGVTRLLKAALSLWQERQG